jgi:hypothetical protein
MTQIFWGWQGWLRVASRGSRVNLSYYDHPVVVIVRVKALLGFFTRRREDAKPALVCKTVM